MALTKYNKKLLQFIYKLTKLKGYNSNNEISKKIIIDDEQISAKTIGRWFDYLKQFCFDYHIYLDYEDLGLQYITVFLKGDVNTLLNKIVFQNSVFPLISFNSFEITHQFVYLVPKQYVEEFKKEVKELTNNTKTEIEIYECKTALDIFNILDECIDEEGYFHPQNRHYKEQRSEIAEYLKTRKEIKIHQEIKKNPLIIPLYFEHYHEKWSSKEI